MAGLQPNKTVVPIDFSDLSYEALDRGLEIAGDRELHVVHVLVELSVMEPGLMYGTPSDAERIAEVEKTLREKLSDEKYDNVTIHAVVGEAGREIADYAERVEADLIVSPSHGHGFFKHILLGSTAERVVRMAHCPVLVLRK